MTDETVVATCKDYIKNINNIKILEDRKQEIENDIKIAKDFLQDISNKLRGLVGSNIHSRHVLIDGSILIIISKTEIKIEKLII